MKKKRSVAPAYVTTHGRIISLSSFSTMWQCRRSLVSRGNETKIERSRLGCATCFTTETSLGFIRTVSFDPCSFFSWPTDGPVR